MKPQKCKNCRKQTCIRLNLWYLLFRFFINTIIAYARKRKFQITKMFSPKYLKISKKLDKFYLSTI